MAEPLPKHAEAPPERPSLSLVPPLSPETEKEIQLREHVLASRYYLIHKLAAIRAATIRARGTSNFTDLEKQP